jgi:serine protease AprX
LTYARRHRGRRSEHSLHGDGCPPGTFPFYHPAEETVLSQQERLPGHWGFTGKGVTVAFLDSGYFPHPDLSALDVTGDDVPQADLSPFSVRRALQNEPSRVRQYVNLFEGRERTGLDSPSLWSDAPSNWHGMMASVIALGNGRLSGGRYRGYAPEAEALLIKIGRKNGRIPEQDILAGMNWLLHNDNWQRYGVRVLNVSVGGDYVMGWWENAVCLAAEKLSKAGVLVVSAGGNGNSESLFAPAQAPSAITVGGVDDGNRPWQDTGHGAVERIQLYHHNWGEVHAYDQIHWKPEILAPARWLPSPYLPVSRTYREAWVLGQAWAALEDGNFDRARTILEQWLSLLKMSPRILRARPEWVRRALRIKMNSHKWIHPYYQHVDGTSVAAPQVAAVAAQMFQANPNLSNLDVKFILTQTAVPLGHLPMRRVGAGLLRPTRAVAAAMRARHGVLAGFPYSGAILTDDELRDLGIPGKVAASPVLSNPPHDAVESQRDLSPVYFGLYAPEAEAVSLVGSFNNWLPGDLPLLRTDKGWWHNVYWLPPGDHPYRFWVVDSAHPHGDWLPDPENGNREESGYLDSHSVISC